MSPADQLVAKLYQARLSWFEVAPGKRLQILRPTEVQMLTERGRPALEVAQAQVVAWAGYTEADLLGAEVGSDQPAPFTADLWAAYVADSAELAAAVAVEVDRLQVAYLQRRQEQAKN